MAESRFLDAARDELLAAIDGYEAESPGLGVEFLDEVEEAVERIATFPAHGNPHLSDTRRLVLRRFPYDVVYVEESNGLLVVAVAHHKRSPGYWRQRIR